MLYFVFYLQGAWNSLNPKHSYTHRHNSGDWLWIV